MGDRTLVYPGEVPFDVDILQSQLNYYTALARYMNAVTGNTEYVNGLTAGPSSPPALSVDIAPGEYYSLQDTDVTPYGSIPSDTTQIVKQAVLSATSTLLTPAPGTPGESINYLVQVAFQETDGDIVNRTFYAAPSANVATQRLDEALVNVKAGTAAPTGTQVTPTPDAGFLGLWVVTVANGQTTVTAGDISAYAGTVFLTEKLQDKISQATADARYVFNPPLGGQATYQTLAESSAPQNVGTATTVFQIDTASLNPQGWWDTATFRLTPTIPCTMICSAAMNATSNADQQIRIFMRFNGTAINYGGSTINASNTKSYVLSGSSIINFNGTTDYLEVCGYCDGTTMDVQQCSFKGIVQVN